MDEFQRKIMNDVKYYRVGHKNEDLKYPSGGSNWCQWYQLLGQFIKCGTEARMQKVMEWTGGEEAEKEE